MTGKVWIPDDTGGVIKDHADVTADDLRAKAAYYRARALAAASATNDFLAALDAEADEIETRENP